MPTPTAPIPPQWDLDLATFRLHEEITGKAKRTIAIRVSRVGLLARWLADPVNGQNVTSPDQVTRDHRPAYLAGQIKRAKFSGVCSVYSDLAVWWKWYAEEYGTASPMERIARPSAEKFRAAVVPVLTQEQFAALL